MAQRKIAILSNAPHSTTGYANQVRAMLPQLERLGYETAVIAFYGVEGGVLKAGNTRIYPRGQHPYGLDVADAHTTHFNNGPGGVLLSLMDSWVLDPSAFRSSRWCPIFPIDHEPCPPPIRDRVARAYARIVYSQFGLKMMEAEGLACYYAPHMVDTTVYKPKPKVVARQDTRLPNDAFIVGMVAANKGAPSRKCFQQQLQAFAEFHRRHPDTHLHLHTAKGVGVGAEAVNLPELVEYLGIADCTTFADPYAYFLGIPDEGVATVYNAFDVLTNVSMGEGFGIPIVEAQACGVPVVVGDWTSMGELCFAGWAIDKGDADPFWTPLGAFQFVPRVGAIVEAYENAYKYAGDYKLKQTARKGALAYHTETVADTYWRPVLDDLFERIEAEDSAPTFADLAKAAV